VRKRVEIQTTLTGYAWRKTRTVSANGAVGDETTLHTCRAARFLKVKKSKKAILRKNNKERFLPDEPPRGW
jgi:hypothetical protein